MNDETTDPPSFVLSQGSKVFVAPGCSQGKFSPVTNDANRNIDPKNDTDTTFDINTSVTIDSSQPGCGCASCPCPSGGGPEPYMCTAYNKSAVEDAVAAADICVLAVGLGANVESEGRDREKAGLSLPGHQNALVQDAIAAAKARGIPVVALLFVAGPVDPLLFEQADAVIDCFYPAEATGLAIADVLFGRVSPAGRLPFSWPTLATDVPPEANYTMAGRTYRYGQRNVHWPFGFGLSFSSFHYTAASLSTTHVTTTQACEGINVSVSVQNTGVVSADEVVQVYVRWTALSPPLPTPSLSLAAFTRVHIEAASTATVALTVTPRVMAVLTDPQCGVVPVSNDTQLVGQPLSSLHAGTGAAGLASCCSACAQVERCEAYTLQPSGMCELFSAWGVTNRVSGAVSGEPLSQWVLRAGKVQVLVGGSSDTLGVVGEVEVVGADTPVTDCPDDMSKAGVNSRHQWSYEL